MSVVNSQTKAQKWPINSNQGFSESRLSDQTLSHFHWNIYKKSLCLPQNRTHGCYRIQPPRVENSCLQSELHRSALHTWLFSEWMESSLSCINSQSKKSTIVVRGKKSAGMLSPKHCITFQNMANQGTVTPAPTLGTCGLNSTALWMASTAVISAVLKPRFDAMSGENLATMKVES